MLLEDILYFVHLVHFCTFGTEVTKIISLTKHTYGARRLHALVHVP